MTTPKPDARWGRWRYKPVNVAGERIIPAQITQIDRERMDSRLLKNDHDKEPTHNDND